MRSESMKRSSSAKIGFPSSPESAVEITHYSHSKHPLKEISLTEHFVCTGCKEYGAGKRFACQQCDFQLHDFCAFSPPLLNNHPLHGQHQLVFHSKPKSGSTFTFLPPNFTHLYAYMHTNWWRFISNRRNFMAKVWCLWQICKRVYLQMQSMQFPDAPLLRHAIHTDQLPVPPSSAQTVASNKQWFQWGALWDLQQKKIGANVSLHSVRVPSSCSVCKELHQWPPRKRAPTWEAKRIRNCCSFGLSGGHWIHWRPGWGVWRRGGRSHCSEYCKR